jgi:hypothetical protein
MHIYLDLFVLKLVKLNDVCRVIIIIKKIKTIFLLFRQTFFDFFFVFLEKFFLWKI